MYAMQNPIAAAMTAASQPLMPSSQYRIAKDAAKIPSRMALYKTHGFTRPV